MKFVSKLNHYRIMLRHGIPGNPLMAIPPTPGVHALFTDGQFFTEDEEIISLLKANKQCGVSYFMIEDLEAADPFKGNRKSAEPVHAMMEMGQGSRPGKMMELPKQENPALKAAAEELLTRMMPAIVAKVREQVMAEQAVSVHEETADAAPQTTTTTTEDAPPATKAAKAPKKAKTVTKETTEAAEPMAK